MFLFSQEDETPRWTSRLKPHYLCSSNSLSALMTRLCANSDLCNDEGKLNQEQRHTCAPTLMHFKKSKYISVDDATTSDQYTQPPAGQKEKKNQMNK